MQLVCMNTLGVMYIAFAQQTKVEIVLVLDLLFDKYIKLIDWDILTIIPEIGQNRNATTW